jgi:hypothetical protein
MKEKIFKTLMSIFLVCMFTVVSSMIFQLFMISNKIMGLIVFIGMYSLCGSVLVTLWEKK